MIKILSTIMIVWIGIALYLFTLDRKIRRLEKDLDEL